MQVQWWNQEFLEGGDFGQWRIWDVVLGEDGRQRREDRGVEGTEGLGRGYPLSIRGRVWGGGCAPPQI